MMRLRTVLGSLVLLMGLAVTGASPGAAQFAFEARVGGMVGNYQPAASGRNSAPGPTVTGGAEFTPHRFGSAYAALTVGSFGCETGFCAEQDVTIHSRALAAGGRLHLPRAPWLRAGVISQAVRIVANGATERFGPALGYELGAGTTVPFGRLRILPGVTYRAAGGVDRTSTLSGELALLVRLGDAR
jgi:hypothetical protein